MSLRVRNVQIDVGPAGHDAAVRWWCEALGGVPRATDEPEYTHLDRVRAPIGVHVQRLGDGPAAYHLDLETDGDVADEIDRLVALGATDVGPLPGGEIGRILADPASLLFCVTATGQPQHLSEDRALAAVTILSFDVPAPMVEREATFWAAALGAELVPPGPKHPEFRGLRGVAGAGGGIGVLIQELGDGPARLHVDLHVPDVVTRDQERARLVELGARVRQEAGHWVVLEAPGGHLVCLVPDDPG